MQSVLDQSPTVILLQGITALAALVSVATQVLMARRYPTAIAAAADDRQWFWMRHATLIACIGSFGVIVAHAEQGVPIHAPTMALFSSYTFVQGLHWFHVWFVAWPAARFGAGTALTRASAVLRLNVATSVPLGFFFYASMFRSDLGGEGRWIREDYWALTLASHLALEFTVLGLPRLSAMILRPVLIAILLGCGLSLLVTQL